MDWLKVHKIIFAPIAFALTCVIGLSPLRAVPTFAPLGDLPGGEFYSAAHGISADGSYVVGYSRSALGYEAFIWDKDNGMRPLGDLPGDSFYGTATAVSADGSHVVGWSFSVSGHEAFIWDEVGGMQGLGDLPGGDFFYSTAADVSADGSVVVGDSYSSYAGYSAFIWDETGGMRKLQDVLINDWGLDLTGWHLSYASGISDDGSTICGIGINPDGLSEAWMARL